MKNCLLRILLGLLMFLDALCVVPLANASTINYAGYPRRVKPNPMAACGIDWASWSNVNSTLAQGQIATANGTVNVTMEANMTGSTAIYNLPKFNESPQPVPDRPVPQTIWGTGNKANSRVCFSQKVSNPIMLISSLGSDVGNNQTSLKFSAPYIVLYDGGGMTYDNDSGLTGFEGFAIIVFPGEYDCINIISNNEEYYSNVTWGLSPVTSPVSIDVTGTSCGVTNLQAVGGNGVSYKWYGGGEAPDAALNHVYQSGYYMVAVTDANGCINYAGRPLAAAVGSGPPATISGNPVGCGSVTLTASPGQTYKWNGGLTPNDRENKFTSNGKYSVVITQADGCVSYAEQEVTVGPPGLRITGSTSGCDAVTLTASGALYYLWSGGLTPANAINTFTTSGTYTLLATDINGCSSTTTKTIVVTNSAANVTGNTTSCEKVTLTASGGVTYSWNGGLTPNNAVNTFTTGGLYTVTITSANGCKAHISRNVTISPPYPTMVTVSDCGSTTITANGWETYAWDAGETPNSATNTFRTSGIYHLTLTDATGCETTIPVSITVEPPLLPAISITANTQVPVCAGTLINFTATGTDEGPRPLYEWFKNLTKVGEGKTYSATDLNNGDRITCRLTAARQCIIPPSAISDPVVVQITTSPTITVNQTLVITDENALQLNPVVTGNIVSYQWTPSTGLSNTGIKNPLANPEATTTYTLSVVNTTGCAATADITVIVARGLNIPNTFTPNADGINDVWKLDYLARYPNARVDVYNRYGKQIFHSIGYRKPWDGTYLGKQLPAGVYYYIIDPKTTGQKPQTGYITVLR